MATIDRTKITKPSPIVEDDQGQLRARQGISREVVGELSKVKGEPDWMAEKRLKSLEIFERKPVPTWGAGPERSEPRRPRALLAAHGGALQQLGRRARGDEADLRGPGQSPRPRTSSSGASSPGGASRTSLTSSCSSTPGFQSARTPASTRRCAAAPSTAWSKSKRGDGAAASRRARRRPALVRAGAAGSYLRFDTNDYSLDPRRVGRRVEVASASARTPLSPWTPVSWCAGTPGRSPGIAHHRARARPGAEEQRQERRGRAEPEVEVRSLTVYDQLIA